MLTYSNILKIFNIVVNIAAAIHISLLVSSCIDKTPESLRNNNKGFLKNYGSQLRDMQRRQEVAITPPEVLRQRDQRKNYEAVFEKSLGTISLKSASISDSQFKYTEALKNDKPAMIKPIENRDAEFIINTRHRRDIFKLRYNPHNHGPFRRSSKVSFDDIKIPAHDAQNSADAQDKDYVMIGNIKKQKTMDKVFEVQDKRREHKLRLLDSKARIERELQRRASEKEQDNKGIEAIGDIKEKIKGIFE